MSYNKPAPQFLFQNHLQVSGDSDKYLLNCSEKNVPKKKLVELPQYCWKLATAYRLIQSLREQVKKKILFYLKERMSIQLVRSHHISLHSTSSLSRINLHSWNCYSQWNVSCLKNWTKPRCRKTSKDNWVSISYKQA